MKRKGFAPVLFGTFLVAFALLIVSMILLGGENVYERMSSDIAYLQPINTMEMTYKFMKQSMIFSTYQASGWILETGGLGDPEYTDNTAIRDGIRTAYWYDTRQPIHEDYPITNENTGRIYDLYSGMISSVMNEYVNDAERLLRRTGDWNLPESSDITITFDHDKGNYTFISNRPIEYDNSIIELKDILYFSVNSTVRPLKQFEFGIEGARCFISDKHKSECRSRGVTPSGFDPLVEEIKDCFRRGYPTSDTVKDDRCCRSSSCSYPTVSDREFRRDAGIDNAESVIESCISEAIEENTQRLNNRYLPSPGDVRWEYSITRNEADVDLYDCTVSHDIDRNDCGSRDEEGNYEDDEYETFRTCQISYELDVDLVAKNIDMQRKYPYLSDNGRTEYRDMALRFLVYVNDSINKP